MNRRIGIPKLTTGIPGFDMLTHGGIPEGRATLVAGRSGTGKTIFALQLAAHLARNDVPPLLVGVEESGEDLLVTADGQRVLVTRGMMNATQSDAELAYVIAKGMAHNILGHATTQRQSSTLSS